MVYEIESEGAPNDTPVILPGQNKSTRQQNGTERWIHSAINYYHFRLMIFSRALTNWISSASLFGVDVCLKCIIPFKMCMYNVQCTMYVQRVMCVLIKYKNIKFSFRTGILLDSKLPAHISSPSVESFHCDPAFCSFTQEKWRYGSRMLFNIKYIWSHMPFYTPSIYYIGNDISLNHPTPHCRSSLPDYMCARVLVCVLCVSNARKTVYFFFLFKSIQTI